MDDDHRRAGDAIRAALRPGERLREHSRILRSPGLDEAPPTAGDRLSAMNPFAGFGQVARADGLGYALLSVALGEPPDDSRGQRAIEKDRALRKYGRTFCGVPGSGAGHLLEALRRDSPAWAALTDQRLVVFAEPGPRPPAGPVSAFLDLVKATVEVGEALFRQPAPRAFTGPVSAVFECAAGAVAASPAPPVDRLPRVVLWFADQSWLVVSLGAGPAGARLTEALLWGAAR
ncbi:hypothetical protein BJY16_006858 [Actinoplanes octamycinicus]|uniref:Uncharacterized protein n=1 Tax=Actinoplanes octamycinicus TaxID=135948 RepID=A0A7W7H3Z5_9ACTN|nr:hypothetical protein [Actinoplanes octamycinicus]MBB4743399.1 hypothetical protein [Actinoplanes octamycinicus]